MDMFMHLGIFNPPSALVQSKTGAYQHQHLLPQVLTPEAIDFNKKKEKKYLVGHFTTSGE